MKRGKEDEKNLEPLFPRLHVNDAGKGGPRAPPRNKMALYEQLSIPSQRFNHQRMAPPRPSNQACASERNSYIPHHRPSSTHVQPAEKLNAPQKPCIANVRYLARHGQSKRVGEEVDFMVPVFLDSGNAQTHERTTNGTEKEKAHRVKGQNSVEIQEVKGKGDKQNGFSSVGSRQETGGTYKENRREGTRVYSLDLPNVAHLRQYGCEIVAKDCNSGRDSRVRGESYSGEEHSNADDDEEQCRRNGDVSDGVSETSMVDSVSSSDISPDDVAGIIGQKRFWNARRAIANQQRVFAVQVFELHKLIKVQRLIAASPHLLLNDGTYLQNSSARSSPVKHLSGVPKRKEVSGHRKMERSGENVVVGKPASISSGKEHNNVPAVAASAGAAEIQMSGADNSGSWCYPPPGNHQWLFPVMSPSEGLIYKPYPGQGLMGPSVYGGYYGHFIPGPMAVASPYHPGVGFPYIPPYSMPCAASNTEQQSSCDVPNTSVPASATATTVTAVSKPRAARGKAGGGTRVIRVVPHNPMAATESAARIFRSIQAERKQSPSDSSL